MTQQERDPPVLTQQLRIADEDLNLMDLWRIIAKRKWVLLSSWALAGIFTAIYVFLAEPMYRSEARLLPPAMKDVQGLSISVPGIIEVKYTPEVVYTMFIRNLRSPGVQKEFFGKYALLQHYMRDKNSNAIDVDRVFNENFKANLIIRHDKHDNDVVEVSFDDSDPSLAANWLNKYVDFVNEETVRHFYLDVDASIRAEVERARAQVLSKRTLAVQRRNDQIVRIQEALRIAKALNIKDIRTISGSVRQSEMQFLVNAAESPLYMRGEKALEKEIAVLNARKEDDAFIAGLRDIQEELAFLEAVSIDFEKLSAVTVDVAPQVPWEPFKPRAAMVFMLAFMVATFLGLCAVFLTESLTRVRREPN